MQSGTMDRIFSYYLNNPKFADEIKRAKNEFFEIEEGAHLIAADEKMMPFFMEWLTFDFRLKSGESLLEHYYYNNPKKLALYDLQIYKDLQENVYGILEAKKIDLDKGMKVLVTNTGEQYYVHERSATHGLKVGNLFFARVGRVGDHYELVGSDSFIFNVRINDKLRKSFKTKEKLTPKLAAAYYGGGNDDRIQSPDKLYAEMRGSENEELDILEIKAEFNQLLKNLDAYRLINVDLVQEWLLAGRFRNNSHSLVDIVFSLSKKGPSKEQLSEILRLTMQLLNYSPQKKLKGKSPNEILQEDKQAFGSQGFESALTCIGGEWPNVANSANRYLREGNIESAFDEFDEVFRIMLKEQNTNRYVFSFFANAAVCYLYSGSEFMARRLLETALEIRGNYEFAKNLLAEIDSGKNNKQLADSIRSIVKAAPKKDRLFKDFEKASLNYSDAKICQEYYKLTTPLFEEIWKASYPKKYADFLKRLKINFDEV